MYVMQQDNNFFVYSSNNELLVFDENYMHLLNFASYEKLNHIEGLLEIFFDEVFDFERLKLKEDRPLKEETDESKQLRESERLQGIMAIYEYDFKVNVNLEKVLFILKEMHPFFENDNNASDELESIIIDYFNTKCSLNEYVIGHRDKKDGTKIITEYANLLNPILDDYLHFHYVTAESRKKKLEEAYDDYIKKYSKADNDLVSFQKRLNIWLKNFLDINEKHKYLINDTACNHINMYSSNSGSKDRIIDCNLPLEIFVDHMGFQKRHIVNNFRQFICFQVLQMIQDKIEIKTCANPDCSKYFVLTDRRAKYCSRNESPSCEAIGKEKCKEKREEKPLYKEYRKAQSKYRTYVKRGDGLSEEAYHFWNEEAVRLRDANNEMDFLLWCKLKKDEIACKYKESMNAQ